MAQLSVNRLPLPKEIHIIIKDYAFPDKEIKRIMEIKKNINRIINGTIKWNIMDTSIYYIIIYENKLEYHYYMHFCNKCGNYKNRNHWRIEPYLKCIC